MLKRISVVLVSALLMVAVAASVALAAPGIEGCSGTNLDVETCDTGGPTTNTPSCWGDATSEFASDNTDESTLGDHTSSQSEPRKGVGNVARTDGGDGTRPFDHAAVVGPVFNGDDFSCEPV